MVWLFLLLIIWVQPFESYGDITPGALNSPSQREDNWLYLTLHDVSRITGTVIRASKLQEIMASIVPHDNISIDPLNKFVPATYVLENINPILMETIHAELKFNEDARDTKEILEGMQDFLSMILEQAIVGRTIKLSNMQKEREQNELILAKDKLTRVLQNIPFENKPADEIVDMLLAVSKESFTNPEIKKSLSYPVVKEVLVNTLKNRDTHDMESADIIISILEPFLKEALHKEDMTMVNSLPSNITESALVQRASSHIKECIEKAIKIATQIDSILRDELEHAPMSAKMESLYIERVYEEISLILLKKEEPTLDTREDPSKTRALVLDLRRFRRFFMGKATILRFLHKEIAQSFNEEEKTIVNNALPDINSVWFLFGNHIKDRLFNITRENPVETYIKPYIETHQSFMKGNIKRLSDFVSDLVMTRYKEIDPQHLGINYLKEIFEEERIFFDPVEYLEDSVEIKQFLKELETEVTTNYHFAPGMFIYSISYHMVLHEVFESFSNPFDDSKANKADQLGKEEL